MWTLKENHFENQHLHTQGWIFIVRVTCCCAKCSGLIQTECSMPGFPGDCHSAEHQSNLILLFKTPSFSVFNVFVHISFFIVFTTNQLVSL